MFDLARLNKLVAWRLLGSVEPNAGAAPSPRSCRPLAVPEAPNPLLRAASPRTMPCCAHGCGRDALREWRIKKALPCFSDARFPFLRGAHLAPSRSGRLRGGCLPPHNSANCASCRAIAICRYPVRPFPPFKVRGAPAYGHYAGVFASDATLRVGRVSLINALSSGDASSKLIGEAIHSPASLRATLASGEPSPCFAATLRWRSARRRSAAAIGPSPRPLSACLNGSIEQPHCHQPPCRQAAMNVRFV
jgi:hypothetical protein